jgi:hypothetical protein
VVFKDVRWGEKSAKPAVDIGFNGLKINKLMACTIIVNSQMKIFSIAV